MFSYPVLVGDIGGTNARFAIVLDAHSGMQEFEPVHLSDHHSIEDIIQKAVLDKTADWPRTMILAAATPLTGPGPFALTNADITLDPGQLVAQFDLDQLVLMNDFAAQALAAIALDEAHLEEIERADGTRPDLDVQAPRVIVGPGTGLGVANAVKVKTSWAVLPGEGGHIDLGPCTPREFAVWPHLQKLVGRVSAEEVLSGRGIRNLYQAIQAVEGGEAQSAPQESEITGRALAKSDPLAVECCEMFVRLLGRVSGNLALITLARGGVYIGGGIATKMLPLFKAGDFVAAFEDKAPHGEIMKEVPLRIMTHKTSALQGLASFAQSPALYTMNQAARYFDKAGSRGR